MAKGDEKKPGKVHGGGTPPVSPGGPDVKEGPGAEDAVRLSELQEGKTTGAQATGRTKPARLSDLQAPKGGIRCPECNCADLQDPRGPGWETVKTVPIPGGVRRYRVCRNCGARVRTAERIDKRL